MAENRVSAVSDVTLDQRLKVSELKQVSTLLTDYDIVVVMQVRRHSVILYNLDMGIWILFHFERSQHDLWLCSTTLVIDGVSTSIRSEGLTNRYLSIRITVILSYSTRSLIYLTRLKPIWERHILLRHSTVGLKFEKVPLRIFVISVRIVLLLKKHLVQVRLRVLVVKKLSAVYGCPPLLTTLYNLLPPVWELPYLVRSLVPWAVLVVVRAIVIPMVDTNPMLWLFVWVTVTVLLYVVTLTVLPLLRWEIPMSVLFETLLILWLLLFLPFVFYTLAESIVLYVSELTAMVFMKVARRKEKCMLWVAPVVSCIVVVFVRVLWTMFQHPWEVDA